MSWQILLVLSIITTSLVTLLQRGLVKKETTDPISAMILQQLIAAFFMGIFALARGFKMPDVSLAPSNFLLVPVIWAGANALIFTSLKTLEASTFTILFTTRAVWTIAAATIFLGETFSSKQIAGTLLILSSVVIAFWRSSKFSFHKGSVLALLGSMLFGLGLANDSFIIRAADVPSYFAIALPVSGLLIWGFFPKSSQNMKKILVKTNSLFYVVLIGFFVSITALTYYLAYQLANNAAQLASINQTSTLLTVILAIVFLKEKTHIIRKILAAVLSVIGAILVL